MKTCKQCHTSFEVAPEDHELLDKISPIINEKKYSLPEPTLCPECQLKRRFCFRNQFLFYKRPSSLSDKSMVSIYSPDKPDVVYSYDEWWSDKWDSLEYGRNFDFNRPFFEQFHELFRAVPKITLIQDGSSENSEYTNFGVQNKNCYLTLGVQCEDVYCSTLACFSKNCIGCYIVLHSERLYECIDASACYNSAYLQNCRECSDSWFLESCINCQNCLGCKNLRNKQYHIFNKPYKKEEYKKIFDEYQLNTYSGLQKFKEQFEKFKLTLPFKFIQQKLSEDSTGDFLNGAKKCHHCFDVVDRAENSRFCVFVGLNCHDLMSCSHAEGAMNYESDGLYNSQRILFSHFIRNCSDLFYCIYCYNCQNLFGCTGMRRKQYCILNKQYSKQEYEELVPKIIEYMRNTGEWGEFFPPSISPFGYNETLAYEHFSFNKTEAKKKGFNLSDYEAPLPKAEKTIPAARLPDDINDIPDDILNWAIECEVTKKPFKIIPQELKFYREHQLPIPHRSPDQRRLERTKRRNPYKLWKRKCDKCGTDIQTTYSPDRPEIVYCEACYLKEVY